MRRSNVLKLIDFSEERMTNDRATGQDDIFAEITKRLEPFRKGETPITLDTDITRDLNIDSLAVMDMIMELEDRFDVSIPLNVVAEIKTVRELADTIGSIRRPA